MKILNLCKGSCCPQVIVEKNEVKIGEKGNLVKLNVSEWNTLIDAVKKGRVNKL